MEQEVRVFFFVNKKTLIPVGCGTDGANTARRGAKVFWLLFFKKVTAYFLPYKS
jgi:hypothetical protein